MAVYEGAVRNPSWPLVEALQPLPCLADLNSRNFIVKLLNDELGQQLPIEESTHAVQHVFNIVDVCRRQPDGLMTLLVVLGRFDRDTTYFPSVQRIVADMTVPEMWPKAPKEEREELFALLSGMDFSDIELYRQVAGSAAPQLPARTTYQEVFFALETLNATTEGLPKPLVFIEHLAHRVRPELAIELRRWADRQAAHLQLVTELQALRRGFRALPPGPAPHSPAYLVLLLRYEGRSGDRYRLSHWRQLDLSSGWHPERGDDFVGTIGDIKRRIAMLIEGVEADWARHQPDIHIEVVLSGDLLNLDVDQWPWESDSQLPVPVGCRYAMVVRSLDRMQHKAWHRLWHARWGTLSEQMKSNGAVARGSGRQGESAGEASLRSLAAEFEKDPELVFLMLSAPPQPALVGRDEVAIGLRAGVPVIVWHRENCRSEEFLSAVNEVLHEGPGTILQRARQMRADAFGTDGSHVGRHLALLWDDPERIVVPIDAGPPPKGESAA